MERRGAMTTLRASALSIFSLFFAGVVEGTPRDILSWRVSIYFLTPAPFGSACLLWRCRVAQVGVKTSHHTRLGPLPSFKLAAKKVND